MSDRQENYLKLLTRVKEVYGDYSHIYLDGTHLYFHADDRYRGHTCIELTEEQVMELARGIADRLEAGVQKLRPYIEDYDYFVKLESEGKEIPETT